MIGQNIQSLHVKIISNMLFSMYWRNCKGDYFLQILSLFSERFVFLRFYYYMCRYLFVYYTFVQVPKKQEQGVSSSGAGITGCFELSKVGTESNLGPALLSTEISLLPFCLSHEYLVPSKDSFYSFKEDDMVGNSNPG